MKRANPQRASAALLLLAAVAAAQESQAAFTLDAGEYQVARLLELGSRQLRCSILVNPALLTRLQPITVAAPIRADAADAAAMFTDLLYSARLAMIPVDASLRLCEVVTIDGPRGREITGFAEWKTPAAVLQRPTAKQAVTTVVPLAHVDAGQAAKALRAHQPRIMTLQALVFGATAGGNAVVLNGLQDQVAAAIAVVLQADQAAAAAAPAAAPAEQLEARLAGLDKQVAEVEKQLAELQQKKPGTTGK